MTEEEIDALQVGSVIRYGRNRVFRIVRTVYRRFDNRCRRPGAVVHVGCAKKKCNFYPRTLAAIDRHFLRRHCEVTGARHRLDHATDKALARDSLIYGYGNRELCCEIVRDMP